MGFRTLSIEKKSSEVWDVLSVIKKEFSQFGNLIEKTQKKIQEASNAIKNVEEISHEKTLEILGLTAAEYESPEIENENNAEDDLN
jgi:DNA recombination protein RmuC